MSREFEQDVLFRGVFSCVATSKCILYFPHTATIVTFFLCISIGILVDMGLGKTIQSIASMSIYHDEWPLLILTPSSARYHWAAEFNNWLGSESSVNKKNNSIPNNSANHWENLDPCEEEVDTTVEPRKPMRLLRESEIHVMVAGKEKIFPNKETRIVICSYGLATSLVDSGKLRQGLFRCAIVDER